MFCTTQSLKDNFLENLSSLGLIAFRSRKKPCPKDHTSNRKVSATNYLHIPAFLVQFSCWRLSVCLSIRFIHQFARLPALPLFCLHKQCRMQQQTNLQGYTQIKLLHTSNLFHLTHSHQSIESFFRGAMGILCHNRKITSK